MTPRHPALTYRQEQVLDRIAAGRGHDEIAWELGISASAVKHRRDDAVRRLGAPSTAIAISMLHEWRLRYALALDYTRRQPRDRHGKFTSSRRATPADQLEIPA